MKGFSKYLLVFLMLTPVVALAQKEANTWYFGYYAGLDFNNGGPVALTNSGMYAYGGCTGISDTGGNIQFYSNGATVYNKNHQTMYNGSGLMGDYAYGNWGQSVVSVPRPGYSNYYYIFSINRNNTNSTYPDALRYTRVYMADQNGLGSVNYRNYPLAYKTFDARISSVKHRNGTDYWVLCHLANSNKFYAYRVTQSGVSTSPVISSAGAAHFYPYSYNWWNGSMKISPDGKKIATSTMHYYAYPNTYDSVACEVFDFNDSTGVVSGGYSLKVPNYNYFYWNSSGVEFSPDGSKLYISDHAGFWYSSSFDIYQFEVNAGSPQQTQNSIVKVSSATNSYYYYYSGNMQLGPDGKIYIAKYYNQYLGVVNAPNQKGVGCCYSDTGVYLAGKRSMNGLPNFVTTWFYKKVFDWEDLCEDEVVHFTLNNTSCLDSLLWDFGDTTSGTMNHSTSWYPVHTYAEGGNYSVNLKTFRKGTVNSTTYVVNVKPKPHLDFAVNDSSQCLSGNYFVVSDSSVIKSGSLDQYLWDFDDNTFVDSVPDTSHIYSVANTYMIKLKITSDLGCADSLSKSVVVHPMPDAAFAVNDTVQCLNGNTFVFQDSSTIQSGSYQNYWFFPDTTLILQGDTSYWFTTPDTVQIKMLAVSDQNCSDSAFQTVYVHPSPLASFAVSDTALCLSGNYFYFSDSSSIANDTLTWFWDFDDNQSSVLKNTGHSYSSDGVYSVKHVVTTSLNCKDSVSKNITVLAQPDADFTINSNAQCFNGNNFQLSSASTINQGSLYYNWELGDSTFANGSSINHSYLQPDTFMITLRVNSGFNCLDSITKPVYVFNSPQADFTINNTQQCFNEQAFQFSNTSQIDAGTLSYIWNFGDGNLSTTYSPSHYYSATGNYDAEVIAISNLGCKDSMTKAIVLNPSPLAAFSLNDSNQCFDQNNFQTINNSSLTYGSMTYWWDFGDSSSSGNSSPAHIFLKDDSFAIQLLAITQAGCRDSVLHNAYVFPSPRAKFGINDSSQCFEKNNFIFYNYTKINSGSYSSFWDFGDLSTSTQQVPAHHYLSADTFTVALITISNLGCTDTIKRSTVVHVHPMPVAAFSVTDSAMCLSGNLFSYQNASTLVSGTLNYLWDFGDSNSSTLVHPTNTFIWPDSFEVKLKAISDFGCMDSAMQQVVVYPMPEASFTVDTASLCLLDNLFNFNSTSTIQSGKLRDYYWDLDDGFTDSATYTSHSFSTADTFYVFHKVVSSFNCPDSVVTPVYVRPMPISSFRVNDSGQCLSGNQFEFFNQSSVTGGSISSYYWNFGDFTKDTSLSPLHTYTTYDTLTIQLIAETPFHCRDTAYRNVIVFPMPVAEFTIDKAEQCLRNNLFQFNDSSNIVYGLVRDYAWAFSDSSLFSSPQVSYSFDHYGWFTIKLKVSSGNSCSDSASRKVRVNPMPETGFSVNEKDQCIDSNNYFFTNLSAIDSGSLSWQWWFGDGSKAMLMDAVHTYLHDSTFRVELISISDKSCSDSVTKNITVHPLPVASFAYSQPCIDENIYFSDSSWVKSPDQVTQWLWNLDNTSSQLQDPVNMYSLTGIKTVKLTAVTDYGCQDDTIQQFIIEDYPDSPTVDFVTVNENGFIDIQWTPSLIYTVTAYELERAIDQGTFTPLANFDATASFYTDRSVSSSEHSYTYRLRAKDTCKHYSAFSNMGKSILLTMVDSLEFPLLNWTAYTDWAPGIDRYGIYTFDEGNNIYNLFDQATTGELTYLDEITELNQGEYCYFVEAVKSGDESTTSKSNVDCVPTKFYIWTPNAFTPNQDGINDEFRIVGKNVISFELSIFNRWGEMMFYSKDMYQGWDGKFKNQDCPPGSYSYILRAWGTDYQKRSINGSFLLLR